MSFIVRRNGTAASLASVDYRTIAGSATDGLLDYAPMSGTLEFPVGVRTGQVAVRIRDDDIPEDDEYFTIQLSNPVGKFAKPSNSVCLYLPVKGTRHIQQGLTQKPISLIQT